MGIVTEEFGRTKNGEAARLYTMVNGNGMKVSVSDYGAVLVKLIVPDADAEQLDVVLGFDSVEGYEQNTPCFGATIGRTANRTANGELIISGKTYKLAQNEGKHNLHSGPSGYQNRMWEVKEKEENGVPSVSFFLKSPDGDQGFPGTADITVTYTLNKDNTLIVEYDGVADQDTVFNLTNHSYFNLNGHSSGSVLGHDVWIDADFFTVVNQDLIPTGELMPVDRTPMDFREWRKISEGMGGQNDSITMAGGYDHNFVLNHWGDFSVAAKLHSEVSGITMTVSTDLPGIQFYTGNGLDGKLKGKDGMPYGKRAGACFETQYFPDAVHHDNFVSPVKKAGERYHTSTSFQFDS